MFQRAEQILQQLGGRVCLFLLCFLSWQSAVAQMPNETHQLEIVTDIYSETYASPFNFNPINFQRIQEEFRSWKFSVPGTSIDATPFVSFENYNDLLSTNETLAAGLKFHLVENLNAELALRREYLNDSDFTRWNPRVGLIYGNFWSLPWEHTFSDMYAELFYDVPQNFGPFWTFSAWIEGGYRHIEIPHFTFDPFVVGYRDGDNANAVLDGADYQSFLVGPQCSFYFENPEFSVTMKVDEAWTSSRTAPVVNQLWYLLALGAKF